jgi:hypothetical protein
LNHSQSNYQQWLDIGRFFAAEMKKQPNCSLRIVCHGVPPASLPKGIQKHGMETYCTVFDVLFLSMYVLSTSEKGKSLPNDLKMYLSYLAAEAFPNDAESVVTCIPRLMDFEKDPLTVLVSQNISRQKAYRAVSIAQMKSLLPKIEEQRLRLIAELPQLDSLLENKYIDNYNNEIRAVTEFELRHLVYEENRLRLTSKQSDRLKTLYDARNLLSHTRIVSHKTAAMILSEPAVD